MTTEIEIHTRTSEQRSWRAWAIASGVALATLSACATPSGELGGVDEDDDAGDSDGGSTGPGLGASEGGEAGESGESGEPEPMACDDVGSSLPRSLTELQYANTVRDLFGITELHWIGPGPSPWTHQAEFGTFDALTPLPEVVMGYQTLAAQVAQEIEPTTLLPCPADTPDPQTCAETFVPQLGRATWRRPLTPEETSALLLHYQGVDLLEGTRAVVEALLASPEFYVLREQGTPSATVPGVIELDDHSIATRMSYFLWGSTPDEILLAHADAAELTDPTIRASEAERMLADPRASASIGNMYLQWLGVRGLESLTKAAPEFDEALGAAMETEIQLMTADVVLGSGDGRLATLLHAPYTFVNDGLAGLYGADVLSTTGTPGPQTFVRAELDPAHRGGVMTLPGIMAEYSQHTMVGIARRGKIFRQAWMCQLVPPPPPDVTEAPPYDHRYDFIDTLLAEPVCAGCHVLLEGPQVAFDHYDAIGRWQTEIDGVPVQSDGELVQTSSGTIAFGGRTELVDALLDLPETHACVADHHLRFALRRSLDEADQCTVDALADRLMQTDGDLPDLLVTLVTADTFARVRPE